MGIRKCNLLGAYIVLIIPEVESTKFFILCVFSDNQELRRHADARLI